MFGELMYSEFDDKQNVRVFGQAKAKEKKMDLMHKQYSKLMNNLKKNIVVCNKDSQLNRRQEQNPLQQDKYYQKIMRHHDPELAQYLISCLSVSGNFTFSSFITFYELFIWQQASKQTQIQFVLKLLMGTQSQVPCQKIANKIDFLCSRIRLDGATDCIDGFNEVMKKLIFGNRFFKEQDQDEQALMTR